MGPGGYLYAIGADGTALVKIGYAKRVEKRLKELQTGQPFALRVLASIPVHENVHRIEKQVHAFLQEERHRGEWFEVVIDAAKLEALIVRAIAYIADEERRKEEKKEQRLSFRVAMRVKAERGTVPELSGLGMRITQVREQRGLSRRDLARESGMGEEHLRKVESGLRAEISVATLVRLCKALDMSADYLLGLKE